MAKRLTASAPELRMRVDLARGCSVGPGKVSLLEAIDREGSLSVAARSIGLSYRRAWNLLADLNRSFADPVVETAVGGTSGGGARVTDFGRALVKAFRALERGAVRLAATRMKRFSASANSNQEPMNRRRVSARLEKTRLQKPKKNR
jgi:molybdate transport system regulatory protein